MAVFLSLSEFECCPKVPFLFACFGCEILCKFLAQALRLFLVWDSEGIAESEDRVLQQIFESVDNASGSSSDSDDSKGKGKKRKRSDKKSKKKKSDSSSGDSSGSSSKAFQPHTCILYIYICSFCSSIGH